VTPQTARKHPGLAIIALHTATPRGAQSLYCTEHMAAFPKDLMESELSRHEKERFTALPLQGARTLEQASGARLVS